MAEPKVNELMEKIVALCKRRGFIFQSSEIYGGINGFWDYGPLGAELKRNVKEYWWRCMTQLREDIVGLDASIIMHPKIWEASGHTSTFSDPMVDCLLTKKRYRLDQIDPQSGTVFHYLGAVENWQAGEIAPELQTAIATNLPIDTATIGTGPDGGLAKSSNWEKQVNEPYSVLISSGKHPEYARKIARQYYQQRGLGKAVLVGERHEEVQNTNRYNPENGSLLTEPRAFNLMFKTYVGPVESAENVAYLRPETAQAIFAQFKNSLEVSRQKVPFGICQIGKAFRNEINPRNFTFRSREFEQMELEFFIRPDEAVESVCGGVAKAGGQNFEGALPDPQANWGWEVWHKYWVESRMQWYESIGLPRNSLEEYWQKPEELAHYAKATVDILYKFPFGTQELEGIAARGCFDLSQHQKFSGKSMEYFDEELRNAAAKLDPAAKQALAEKSVTEMVKKGIAEKEARELFDKLWKGQYVPHVIEPSAGVDRMVLALICHAYTEDQAPDEKGKMEARVVMKFHPRIAPIKVAVFPLLKNRPELVNKAREVRDLLRPHLSVFYDDAGAIGRRYRRQDEAGTPFGVTVDFDTLGEKPELKDTVTLRDRDSMKQERVNIHELVPRLLERIR